MPTKISETISINKKKDIEAWKRYWLHPDRTEEEFMALSIRMTFKDNSHALFSLIKGTFYPYCVADEIVNLINEINQRFKVMVDGYGYELGINEHYERGWYKNYPDVAGIIIFNRSQLYDIKNIIRSTKIPYIGCDEENQMKIAESMSDKIRSMDIYPDRVIDLDIPIFAKDLDKLLESLPKLQGITVIVNNISEIPQNIQKDLIIRMIQI